MPGRSRRPDDILNAFNHAFQFSNPGFAAAARGQRLDPHSWVSPLEEAV